MKKYILSIVFVASLMFSNLFAQAEITSRLSDALSEASKENSTVRTLVILKDQVDINNLNNQLYETKATLEERAYIVITTLQEKANATQGSLIEYLDEKYTDEVSEYRSYWITNMVFVNAKPTVVLEMAERNDIAVLDLDAELAWDKPVKQEAAPAKSPGGIEAGLAAINAPAMWADGFTGAGRIVMNDDTGVDGNHPSLNYKWRGTQSGVPASAAWFSWDGGTTFPTDFHYHGTHTMGTMCGLDPATSDTIGVAPGAQWIASDGLGGSPHTSYSIAAWQWAVDPDGDPNTIDDMPDAIGNSWYDPNISVAAECDVALNPYINAHQGVEAAGIAIIFSAGNSGPGATSITQPKNVNIDEVSFFATGSVNGNVAGFPISSFSSRGPVQSNCITGTPALDIKPEVSAPGDGVRSAEPGNSYQLLSGTSMAAPHIVGAIALLREAHPAITGWEAKMALYQTAVDLGDPGEDNTYGTGIIDVYAAHLSLADPTDPNPPSGFTAYSDFNTPTSMLLNWTDPSTYFNGSPLTNFQIYVYRDGSQVATVPGGTETYTDAGLTDGQSYAYSIAAADIPNDSLSTEVSAGWIAGGSAIPSAPTNLVATSDTEQVELVWTDPTTQTDGTPLDDLDLINIYRDGSLLTTVAPGVETYTDMPTPGSAYGYSVSAVDNEVPANESDQSNTVRAFVGHTQGLVLIIDDDVTLSMQVEDDQKGSYLRTEGVEGLAADNMARWLEESAYVVEVVDVATSLTMNWDGYDVVINSSGGNTAPVADAAYRTQWETFVADPTHKYIIEGGEVGYDVASSPGYPNWETNVIHSDTWAGDVSGDMPLRAAYSSHAIANVPNTLPSSLALASPGFGDQDSQNNLAGSYVVYGTTDEPDNAGILVYDDNTVPVSAQMAFFAFNFGVLADTNAAKGLIENTVGFLLTEETLNNDPIMTVNPVTIEDTLLVGETATHYAFVNNDQFLGSTLNYTVTETPDVPWLDVSPLSGSLLSLASDSLFLDIDATGLSAGPYSTQLFVAGDDPLNAEDTIDVSIQVNDAPVISVDPALIYVAAFGSTSELDTLTISNNGSGPLNYTIVTQDVTEGLELQIREIPKERQFNEPVQAPGNYSYLLPTERTLSNESSDIYEDDEIGAIDFYSNPSSLENTEDIYIIGGWASTFTGGTRDRGNFFEMTEDVKLAEHGLYLNVSTSGDIYHFVYEGATMSGTYNLIDVIYNPNSGTGEMFYMSGPTSVTLYAGNYYYIGAAWVPSAEYGAEYLGPYTFPFGSVVFGNTGTKAGAPPAATVTGPTATNTAGYYQTLDIRTTADWLAVDPDTGTVAAMSSVDIELTFDPTGLFGGDYFADINISSNDPVTPLVAVNAQMHVIGEPAIGVNLENIDYGLVFRNVVDTLSFVVLNTGTDTLHVTGMTNSTSEFSLLGTTSFVLAIGDSQQIDVEFTSAALGTFSDSVLIASDATNTTPTVYLDAEVIDPPIVVVDPLAVTDSLLSGQSSTHYFDVINNGASPLYFDIEIVDTTPKSVFGNDGIQFNHLPISMNYPRRNETPSAGMDMGNGSSKPANFSEPVGDLFKKGSNAWFQGGEYSVYFYGTFDTDIPGTMNEILSPPAWNSYCGDFDNSNSDYFYVCHAVDFDIYTVDVVTGVATSVGSTGLGATLNGMACDKTTGIMYAVDSNNLYTIDLTTGAATMVGPIGNTGGLMLTLACDGNGDLYGIDLQTDDLWAIDKVTGTGTAIGPTGFDCNFAQTMNWDPESGLIFWAAYGGGLDGNLRVVDPLTGGSTLIGDFEGGREVTILAFPGSAGGDWISTNPVADTVAVGDTVQVAVAYNSTGLIDGWYNADVNVNSNDPVTSTVTVDASLHVTGVANVAVNPDMLDFGFLYLSTSDTMTFAVENPGTADLNVSGLATTTVDFTVLTATPFTVTPGGSQDVEVIYSAASSGVHADSVVVTHDAPIVVSDVVQLTGETADPPVIALSDTLLQHAMNEGEEDSTTLMIYNNGASTLDFSIVEGENRYAEGTLSLSDLWGKNTYSNIYVQPQYLSKQEALNAATPLLNNRMGGGIHNDIISDMDNSSGGSTVTLTGTEALGDVVGIIDIQTPTALVGNLGVGFDGTYLWVTARDDVNGHQLNLYDFMGSLVGQFPQGTTSVWGMRDLAFDGTYLYAGDDNGFYQIDPTTGAVTNLGAFPNTHTAVGGVIRALAYDPVLDAFWTGNFSNDIVMFDRNDNVIASFSNPVAGIYGMAWDIWDENGPYLWAFAQAGTPSNVEVVQIDPTTGIPTGLGFTGDVTNVPIAGGCEIIPDAFIAGSAVFAGMHQETDPSPDAVYFYDMELVTGLPWVDTNPTEGMVSSGDSAEVTVYWHGVITEQIHDGYLGIYSNDLVNPVENVHLVLDVTVTGIDDMVEALPTKYALHQNFPNPFNPSTTIKYDLKVKTDVKLTIYNVLGQKVRTLVNTNQAAGFKNIVWNGLNDVGEQVATGVYIYRIEADGFVKSRKMVFMK